MGNVSWNLQHQKITGSRFSHVFLHIVKSKCHTDLPRVITKLRPLTHLVTASKDPTHLYAEGAITSMYNFLLTLLKLNSSGKKHTCPYLLGETLPQMRIYNMRRIDWSKLVFYVCFLFTVDPIDVGTKRVKTCYHIYTQGNFRLRLPTFVLRSLFVR